MILLANETDKYWHKGYVSGTFDMFHIGHLNLIRNAKKRCDHLIVSVLSDDAVYSNKKKFPVIPQAERLEIIKAVKYTDEADVTTLELINKVTAWEKYRFDAMFSGDDNNNSWWLKEKEESELGRHGVDFVFFPYTKEVTSTLLQDITLPPKAEHKDIIAVVEEFRRLFPFDKVNKGERIIIYGTGRVGAQYAAQLAVLDYCEVVAFADTNANSGDTFNGIKCLTPNELRSSLDKVDKIVVATVIYRDEIINILRTFGVQPERIV